MNKTNSKKAPNLTIGVSQQEASIEKTGALPKLNKSKVGLREGFTRATVIVQEAKLNKIKEIAYRERISIKDVVDQAFELLIHRSEMINGYVKGI